MSTVRADSPKRDGGHPLPVTPTGNQAVGVRARLRLFRSRYGFAFALLFPLVFALALVNFWPMIWGINTSLQYLYLLNPRDTHFVGLENYLDAWADPLFRKGVELSVIYTVASVAGEFAIGITLALCLNEQVRFRGVFRGLVLLPWVVPSAMGALTWSWMYNGLVGVVNDLLVKLHLMSDFVTYLGDLNWVMPAVVVATIWRGFPFVTVMLLAGLQSIPAELYEAAETDGAGPLARFRHVTLGGLRNVGLITLLLTGLWTFNHVDTIYIMTAGGPGDATLTLALYNFRAAFQQMLFGYGAALSVIGLVITLIFTFFYVRTLMQEETEL